jgi:acetyltransferase
MQTPQIRRTVEAKGQSVIIRAIAPADRDMEAEFVRSLSAQSRYYRFHSALRELTPEMLDRFVTVSYPDNMALIATVSGESGETQIGVARYAVNTPGARQAEVAVVVADEWQGYGIGTALLLELRDLAISGGIDRLTMTVLSQNRRMMGLARQLGFAIDEASDDFVSRSLGKSVKPVDASGPDPA